MPGFAGLSCRSKAVVLTAFCSSPVSRARLSVNVSAIRNCVGILDPEDLHHLVAKVVDDLHGNATVAGLVERAGRVAVERCPRLRVDLRLERRLERRVGVVRAEEV